MHHVRREASESGQLGNLLPAEAEALLQPHRLLRPDAAVPGQCAAQGAPPCAQRLHGVLRAAGAHVRDVRGLPGDAGRPAGRRRGAHHQLHVHRAARVQAGPPGEVVSNFFGYESAHTHQTSGCTSP